MVWTPDVENDLPDIFAQFAQGDTTGLLPTDSKAAYGLPVGMGGTGEDSAGTTEDDVLKALIADWSAKGAAQAEQRGFQAEGKAALGSALGGKQEILGAGEEFRTRMLTSLEEGLQPGREATGKAMDAARALAPDAVAQQEALLARSEERRARTMDDIRADQATAMASYENMTDATMEAQSASIMRGLDNEIQDIVDKARSNEGLDVNDPVVQGRIAKARAQARSTMGTVAGQVSVNYNNTVAQIRMDYDKIEASMAGMQDQLVGAADIEGVRVAGAAAVSGVQLQAQLSALVSQIDALGVQETRAIEQQRLQSVINANLYDLQGQTAYANYLRNMESFVNPIADIILYAAELSKPKKETAYPGGIGAPTVTPPKMPGHPPQVEVPGGGGGGLGMGGGDRWAGTNPPMMAPAGEV